jgi:antirestriction protein
MTTPRIYVASLSDYNAGRLHGKWIDANQSAEAIERAVKAMLAESPDPTAEEWAIHDHEGFAGLSIPECEDFETVASVAAFIEEHGELGARFLQHEGYGEVNEEIADSFNEKYCGAWDSLEDYAEEFVSDCYGDTVEKLPDVIRWHIDYEGIARDMELGGDIYTIEIDGKVHVFNAH